MDYSVFYYTYSTIAQTLASGFGFLVAVALYQIQQINGRLEARVDPMAKLIQFNDSVIRNRARFGEWPHALEAAKEYRTQQDVDPQRRRCAEEEIAAFEADMARLEKVRSKLSLSMIATGVTIGVCLVFMPLTNGWLFLSDARVASVPLAGAIVGALFSIGTYLFLIREITR